VQNGVVLVPATARPLPTATGSQEKLAHEITVGVESAEVAALTEAFAVGTTLTCVARSGQPSSVPDRDVPGKPLDIKVTTIETIVDGKRQVVQFAEPAGTAPPPGLLPPTAPAPRTATTQKN
jgi:hypothetical protein